MAQAGGDGGLGCGWHWTSAFDEHPATIIKPALQSIILSFCICEFLCVFGIKSGNVALARLHVAYCFFRQIEVFIGLVSLLFVVDGVVTVVINRPSKRDNDAGDYCNDDCG